MTHELPNRIEELCTVLDRNRSLDQPDRLRERMEALDRLDALFPGGSQSRSEIHPMDAEIWRHAQHLRDRLENANLAMYQEIRDEIQRGAGPGKLRQYLTAPSGSAEADATPVAGEGYDFLDELVSGILQLHEPCAEATNLDAEMVFYQPTPARAIFDLIDRAGLTDSDLLIDLGSGLGHVPLLVSICTRARSIGIELEPAYIASARQCAAALNLKNVAFLNQDARQADLSAGTVFFLYTPFTGSILRTVLNRLREEAAIREIRIGSFGPCTATIANEPWLIADGPVEPSRIAVFRSRQPSH